MGTLARGGLGRAARGLYGGKKVMTGNNVSFSKNRTKRVWKPNVQIKRLFSPTLDEVVKLRVTTHTLRCVDKAGGLDNYILNLKARHVEEGTLAHQLKGRMKEAARGKQ